MTDRTMTGSMMTGSAMTGMTELATDGLTPALRGALSLFDDALRDVTFPDVDRAALAALADEVAARHAELEAAEAAAAEARDTYEASITGLVTRARRGLAYARIFAEGDRELAARVAEVSASLEPARPTPPSVDAPRKRGRPRKVDASLFPSDEGSADEALDAAQ